MSDRTEPQPPPEGITQHGDHICLHLDEDGEFVGPHRCPACKRPPWKAHPTMSDRAETPEGCKPEEWLSCACVRGTKCCPVDHGAPDGMETFELAGGFWYASIGRRFKSEPEAVAACWAHHDAIADRARAEERAAIVADARRYCGGHPGIVAVQLLADRWEHGEHEEP